MSEQNQDDPANASKGRVQHIRLTGNLEFNLPQADNRSAKPQKEQKSFRNRLFDDLQKPRFWLEVLALLVVGFYTCQAYQANRLTRTLLSNTDGAFVIVGFNSEWGKQAVMFVLTNTGKFTATEVRGTLSITRENPDRTDKISDFYTFGESESIVLQNTQSKEINYPLSGFTPTEAQQIHAGTRIAVASGNLQYYDKGLQQAGTPATFCLVANKSNSAQFLDECDAFFSKGNPQSTN